MGLPHRRQILIGEAHLQGSLSAKLVVANVRATLRPHVEDFFLHVCLRVLRNYMTRLTRLIA